MTLGALSADALGFKADNSASPTDIVSKASRVLAKIVDHVDLKTAGEFVNQPETMNFGEDKSCERCHS